jgi:hypothetical protein
MSQMITTAIRTSTQLGIEVPPIDVVRVNHSMTFLPKRGAISDSLAQPGGRDRRRVHLPGMMTPPPPVTKSAL